MLRLGLRDGNCLPLVRRLRALRPAMRTVVVTDVDSFASVVLALRAGADDYLATPIDEEQLIAGLAGRRLHCGSRPIRNCGVVIGMDLPAWTPCATTRLTFIVRPQEAEAADGNDCEPVAEASPFRIDSASGAGRDRIIA